jgi:ubiquinone/menaquinone biosynthesis C-methylase UbiE
MANNQEVRRLQDVYRNYDKNRGVITRWSDSNTGNIAIIQERKQMVVKILQEHGFLPLTHRKILDVGCGFGHMLNLFRDLGAIPSNLFGVDLRQDRIREAKENLPEIVFQAANAEYLGFKNDTFDLILLFTVFSSIFDDGMMQNIANEVYRILKPGGAIIWYDMRYNNPYNRNVRGMNAARIRGLFPTLQIYLTKITLIPPLARRLGRFAPRIYPLMAAIPWLRTHYLGLMTKS